MFQMSEDEVSRMSLRRLESFMRRNKIASLNFEGGVLSYRLSDEEAQQVVVGVKSETPQVVDLVHKFVHEVLAPES